MEFIVKTLTNEQKKILEEKGIPLDDSMLDLEVETTRLALKQEMVAKKRKILQAQCVLQKAPRCLQILHNQSLKLDEEAGDRLITMFYFITLNFSDEASIEDIKAAMQKIEKRIPYKRLVYGYDQRGGDGKHDFGQGIHVHAVIPRLTKDHKPCKIEKDLYSSCKRLMGGKQYVQVQSFPVSDFDGKKYHHYYEDKIRYIKGDKDKEEKHAVAETTKEWRKQNGLATIYNLSERLKIGSSTVDNEQDIPNVSELENISEEYSDEENISSDNKDDEVLSCKDNKVEDPIIEGGFTPEESLQDLCQKIQKERTKTSIIDVKSDSNLKETDKFFNIDFEGDKEPSNTLSESPSFIKKELSFEEIMELESQKRIERLKARDRARRSRCKRDLTPNDITDMIGQVMNNT